MVSSWQRGLLDRTGCVNGLLSLSDLQRACMPMQSNVTLEMLCLDHFWNRDVPTTLTVLTTKVPPPDIVDFAIVSFQVGAKATEAQYFQEREASAKE